MRSPVRLLPAFLVALALLAAACGGESTETTGAPADTPTDDAASVAADNIDDLVANDDVRLLEVLDVETGEPTTIADTVTGDRPVLLWFWAPH